MHRRAVSVVHGGAKRRRAKPVGRIDPHRLVRRHRARPPGRSPGPRARPAPAPSRRRAARLPRATRPRRASAQRGSRRLRRVPSRAPPPRRPRPSAAGATTSNRAGSRRSARSRPRRRWPPRGRRPTTPRSCSARAVQSPVRPPPITATSASIVPSQRRRDLVRRCVEHPPRRSSPRARTRSREAGARRRARSLPLEARVALDHPVRLAVVGEQVEERRRRERLGPEHAGLRSTRPASRSSSATTGFSAVWKTTAWWPYSRIVRSLSATW